MSRESVARLRPRSNVSASRGNDRPSSGPAKTTKRFTIVAPAFWLERVTYFFDRNIRKNPAGPVEKPPSRAASAAGSKRQAYRRFDPAADAARLADNLRIRSRF